MIDHTPFMSQAMTLAQAAFDAGEVPVGAIVLASDGKTVIGAAHNAPLSGNDPTAHAEILAIRQAAKALGNYRLTDCTLYVTLEPCTMCAGAIANARIKHLVYGAADPKGGAVANGVQFFEQDSCHHKITVTNSVLAETSAVILRKFFQSRRK
jgi:tRNA(Arg) A34 adenosine deaminase TadA